MTEDQLSLLAVVVVNYGDPALLERHLTPVAADVAPARVVVVDSFSTEEARCAVCTLCEKRGWAIVHPDTNTGFGLGCNLGAEAALADGARYLMFLNPDATIDHDSARLLLDVVAADADLLAAPTVRSASGKVWSAGTDLDLDEGEMRSWRRRPDKPGARTMPWVSGACFVLSADLWRRIGGFDDEYFLYWEDVDFCARAHTAGARITVLTDAVAIHDEGQTQTTGPRRTKSATYYYYNIRNRQVFAAKWLDKDQQRRWARSAVRSAFGVLLRGGRRQFLHPVEPLSAAWRGLRDGRRLGKSVRPSLPGAPRIG